MDEETKKALAELEDTVEFFEEIMEDLGVTSQAYKHYGVACYCLQQLYSTIEYNALHSEEKGE